MKYYSTKLPTNDLTNTAAFYTDTLGLPISHHYGHSILLDDHLLLMQCDGASSGFACIYLETEAYNETEACILAKGHTPDYRHSPVGQRIMILKDPEGNTVEIGESMEEIVSEILTLSCGNS